MNWLSVAEIAKTTRIPAPTARRYASLFRDFLPSRKIGRVTRYSDEAVAIFEKISHLYQEGHVTSEIEDMLKQSYSRTIELAHEATTPAQTCQGMDLSGPFFEIMEKFGQCLEIIADQKKMIESHREDIQKLKTGFVLLSRGQRRIKQLPPPVVPALPAGEIQELQERTDALAKKEAEIEELTLNLSFDTSDMKAKLQILESEIARLRKERGEMESSLQEHAGPRNPDS
ncbi:MAG: MerR family transcriptional regulator [Desulfovibrionaceae bacterium]